MKIYKVLTFFLLAIFLFTSCAQKVRIKALEPAEVDRISETKKIAVLSFKNDRVGLSRKIEAQLAGFRINNKKYFTIVSRTDINTIIEEQKLQSSGLVDEDSSVKVGELIGAEAIISGDVRRPTKQDSYYYEPRVKCANTKCSELRYYNVRCVKRVVGLAAEIRVVDVSRGDIIFADTLSRNRIFKHCNDDSRALPSVSIAAQDMANALAREFTYKLTPHYREFYVTLLEDPDLDYTSQQEKFLKFALEYIEQARYDKAEQLLTRLIDSTDGKSYVAFYNLGVIKEAEGKYEEAKEYYEYADNLMVEPVKEINEAIVRINTLIAKRKKTLEQLGK
ncbi:CsgG/HfaB family protein [Sulfurimonas indica]|uniref:CsgG/HfaB family protein n=1 Tax=Sulfurimonas indica TaxID=2508707 RepID=UPI0012642CB1|nr:CsgG/HfaB family protein [Sulfurimonas indica]